MMAKARRRLSGVLLHLTSLPGLGGVGDLGPEAHRMVELLHRAGQGAWQVLPLGPTGFGDSPYQLFSAFAGNPLLVSLEVLATDGLLRADELLGAPPSRAEADYPAAQAYRQPLLFRAAARMSAEGDGPRRRELDAFCAEHQGWLEDYALFMALKEEHGFSPWHTWSVPLRDRHPEALHQARARLAERLHYHRFVQWQFLRQWQALRACAHHRGVELIGDMPIFVAHDSVEVWTQRDQFLLHSDGRLAVQAGVPPDYFSETGQLWGNPLYDWARMGGDGFSFWRRRVQHACRLFDRVRIDHFRGFAAHWEVPGEATTAASGRWVPAPGMALFSRLNDYFGSQLNLIAEDLGVITDDVEELRDRFGFPGMRVLQFAFGDFEPEKVRPYGFRRNLVVYTSTHDNDTFMGWLRGEGDAAARDVAGAGRERRNFLDYVGLDDHEAERQGHWAAIRLCLGSAADLVMFPIQDVLGLGARSRMNRPGSASGNWGFRLLPGQFEPAAAARLREMTLIYGRLQGGS